MGGDVSVEWVDLGDARILYCDYSGLSEEEQIEAMEETLKQYSSMSTGELLVLTNLSGTQTTERVKEKANELTARLAPHTRAQAVIGLEGLRRTLAELFFEDVYIADSYDDAVKWLSGRK